jgi:hypothetical protein
VIHVASLLPRGRARTRGLVVLGLVLACAAPGDAVASAREAAAPRASGVSALAPTLAVTQLISRDTSGRLWLWQGTTSAGWRPGVVIGTGWNSMTAIVGTGDFDGDGHVDLLSRDGAGNLWLYPGNGSGGFLPRAQVGIGWNSMTTIVDAGDFNEDGHADLITRDKAGELWLYSTTGTGGFSGRVRIGVGWASMTAVVALADIYGGPHEDVLARDASGRMWLYPGTGTGGFAPRSLVGTGFEGIGLLTGVGDVGGYPVLSSNLAGRLPGGALVFWEGRTRGEVGLVDSGGAGPDGTIWKTMTALTGIENYVGS